MTALLSLALDTLPASGQGQSLEITGYIGELGEWELTASISAATEDVRSTELSGPLTLRHVGICTQDGPEEKNGDIRLHMSASTLRATLLVDGVECSYRARQSDSYIGMLKCPNQRPAPLTLWIR